MRDETKGQSELGGGRKTLPPIPTVLDTLSLSRKQMKQNKKVNERKGETVNGNPNPPSALNL